MSLVTFAQMVQERLPAAPVRIVVDADFDYLLQRDQPSSGLILRTDYANLEMYFFDEVHMQKWLDLVLEGRCPVPGKEVLESLTPALVEVYLFRAANESLGLNFDFLDFRDDLVRGTLVGFDYDRYLNRLLNKNAAFSSGDAVRQEVDRLRQELPEDPRFAIHGHDFIDALAWFVAPYVREPELRRPRVVERSVVGCCEPSWLQRQRLFARLDEFAG
jgi:hypothetical protein